MDSSMTPSSFEDKPRRGLGRGLGALFGDAEGGRDETQQGFINLNNSNTQNQIVDDSNKIQNIVNTNTENVQLLNISVVEPNRNQPRKAFDPEKLEALAESLKTHGILQPLLVKPVANGMYQIVAGERRWRAARLANIKELPCLVKDYSERDVMEIALIENLQREDLNPIEEAEGYKKLMLMFGMTQEVISERVGKSRPAIANALRLNNLPDKIKQLLIENKLSSGHARAILGISDEEQQLQLAQKIITDGLSVRQAEALSSSINEKRPRTPQSKVDAAILRYYMDVEKILAQKLGTKVKIYPGKDKNRLEIEYYTREDLEKLLEQLS